MYWHANTVLKKSLHYELSQPCGLLEEFHDNGVKAELATLKYSMYVGDSWTWYPTGQPKTHSVREDKKIRSHTEWNDDGSIQSHTDYDSDSQHHDLLL